MSLPNDIGFNASAYGDPRFAQSAAPPRAQTQSQTPMPTPMQPQPDRQNGSRDMSDRQLAWQRAMEQAGSPPWVEPHPAGVASSGTSAPVSPSSAERSPFAEAMQRPPAAATQRGFLPAVDAQAEAMASPFVAAGLRAAMPSSAMFAQAASRDLSLASNSSSLPETPPPSASAVAQPSLAAVLDKLAGWLPAPMASTEKADGDVLATDAGRGTSTASDTASRAVVGADGTDGKRASIAHAGMRLHAEWSGDGVRIWLGADRADLAAVVPLFDRLRQWLAGQGVRLLGAVCNGRPVPERVEASSGHGAHAAAAHDLFAALAPHTSLTHSRESS